MTQEAQKDFNAMLRQPRDMPRVQTVTDPGTIAKYGGSRLTTAGEIGAHLARRHQADFTDPMTAGIFISMAAWASFQRPERDTPYWRTLKAGGELNEKYPGGIPAQRALLEAEGHTVVSRGRTRLRWFVRDYERSLFPLSE